MRIKLKEYAKQRGLTTFEISKMTGISFTNLCAIVAGRRKLGLRTLNALCIGLRCTPNDILEPVSSQI